MSDSSAPFQLQLAPEQLWQAINPWTFSNQGAQIGLFNISLGQTPRPDIERRVLDEVGSYGRQIGHLGEALEVLIAHFDKASLSQDEKDALAIITGEVAKIRQIKEGEKEE
jgi:hypothetical protein